MSSNKSPSSSAAAAARMLQEPCFKNADPGTLKLLLDLQSQILEVAEEKLRLRNNKGFTHYLTDTTETYFSIIFATITGGREDCELSKKAMEPLFSHLLAGAITAYLSANEGLMSKHPDISGHLSSLLKKAIFLIISRKLEELAKRGA